MALLAVVGPGLLAGLSDDDPAGITTYSILGADYGYELLWVLALSTARADRLPRARRAHGRRHRQGAHAARPRAVRAARDARRADARWWSRTSARSAPSSPASPPAWRCSPGRAATSACPVAAVARDRCSCCAARFRRVEHVLLALSAIFVDLHRLRLPRPPRLGRDRARAGRADHAADARRRCSSSSRRVGTTLAPWGLAFIQSYAVDKRLARRATCATSASTWSPARC